MSFKTKIRTELALALMACTLAVVTLTATTASATVFDVTLTETGGSSTIAGLSTLGPYPDPATIPANAYGLFTDPVSGLTTLGFDVNLALGTTAFHWAAGDVFYYESGKTPGVDPPSDLLRFQQNDGLGGTANDAVVYFFSADSGDLAGNSGVIPAPSGINNRINIVGENTTYNAGANGNNPGFTTSFGPAPPQEMHYHIVSPEPVPEPSTLALLGVSAIGLLGYGWRWRKLTA